MSGMTHLILGIRKTLTVFLCALCISAAAEETDQVLGDDCTFEVDHPTYRHALSEFKNARYDCAEREVALLMHHVFDSPEHQARIFSLLAGIKYYTVTDPILRRAAVKDNFVTAYRMYPLLNDEPLVIQLDFLTWMDQAQKQVEDEIRQSENLREYRERLLSEQQEIQKKDRPWYRKWWVYGIGGSVVASAAAIIIFGGEDTQPRDTLPGFPGTP